MSIDGIARGIFGDKALDTVKDFGNDVGNFISDPGKQIKNGMDGLGITNLAQDIEQGLSGGEGWGGFGKNVGSVIAAPATLGASLAGSQWAENAMKGKDVFGKQVDIFGDSNPVASDQGAEPKKDLLNQVGDIIGGGAKLIGDVVGNKDVQNLAGNYLGSQAQADVARRGQDLQKQAYDEMMARSKAGESEFLNANTQTNPALSAYATDLQNLSSQNIGRNQNTINQQLARSGVRGGQAANLYGRQIGELQQSGQRDINKLAYDDFANRNTAKQQYFANKGQSGFNLVPKYS